MGYKYLNLDFLKSLVPGSPDEVNGLLVSCVENINEIIVQVKSSAQKNEWSSLKFSSHQLKSNFKILGMNDIAELVQAIESDAHSQKNLETISNRITNVLGHWEKAAMEIEQELKK